MYFSAIERARMHPASQPRARMHYACGFCMTVGSDHACTKIARALANAIELIIQKLLVGICCDSRVSHRVRLINYAQKPAKTANATR